MWVRGVVGPDRRGLWAPLRLPGIRGRLWYGVVQKLKFYHVGELREEEGFRDGGEVQKEHKRKR